MCFFLRGWEKGYNILERRLVRSTVRSQRAGTIGRLFSRCTGTIDMVQNGWEVKEEASSG